MATTVDPSEASLALAVRLGIAKEGEPMTPLMSMLTTMKDYADHVDIGALAGTQASWATCIPHAEKLLELERKALEELRAKAAEWDSELSSRTGELAELDARFEEMTRETARVGEQLLDANQKQSEATKQLVKTLERTRLSQETHAKDEQRLKLKEDLLTTYSDDLEIRETSLASKEACLKHRWDELEARESEMAATRKQMWHELEARESKMATTQKHAEESETQAKKHLDAIRNAYLILSMLTERTGPETTKLSAHELVVGLQRLGSGIQDQIAHLRDQIAYLNDSRKIVEEAQAEAHEMGNRELKVLRDDVAAKASQIKKAELGAADYKSKLESLQATSSERIHELELGIHELELGIHELELSKHNLLITKNSLEERLSGALQNHKEMEAEYAKYKALERTETALNNRIKYIEERLQVVERQRDDCVAANKTFEVENARLQKFEDAHLSNQKEVEQYMRDRDSQMAELRAELKASKTEAKNAATDIERLRETRQDEISRMGQGSEAKILELEETVKRQEEQLKNVEKLATKREDSLRKADDINTSLYNKLKDGASAIESANKCRMEHQDFDNLKCRLRELQTQVERLSRARIVDREADVRTIKTLKSEKAADSQAIKTLKARIAQLDFETTEARKTDVQTIEALRDENADSQMEVERLRRKVTEDKEIHAQAIKALKGQWELEKAADLKRIEALRSQNADSRREVQRLSGVVSNNEKAISDYTKANSETVKGLKDKFVQYEAEIKELESAKAEATNRATTADHKLRPYQETITRLRSERDEAREEVELANTAHAAAVDVARQARHELESLQQRVTPDNQNGQTANKKVRRKRPAAEMLEEDMPVVPVVGHAYDLQEIRDPEFTDPNIPSEVLDKLHKQFDRWDQKSGRGWTRQITKSRCVEARCAKVSTKHLHGNGHACNYCEDRGRVCVVIRQPGIVNLLPVHQDGEAVGPEDESYWTK